MTENNFVSLSGSVSMTSNTSDITVKIKSNLSTLHLHSAAFLTRSAAKCEKVKEITPELKKQHRAYITGAITLSIASIEATINELFLEAVDGNKNLFKGLPSNLPNMLSQLWESAERFSILEKYQLVLIAAEKEQYNKGEPPYQDVDSAIKLRNALIHYKPEYDNDLKEHKRLGGRLKSKFELNPFVNHKQTFFPHRCLSHGCAEWTVDSCRKFIEAFHQQLGLPPKWADKDKEFLKTK